MRIGTDSSSVPGAQVSPQLFDVLGVSPLRGRTFAGTQLAVVISEALWRQRLGGGNVIGTTLRAAAGLAWDRRGSRRMRLGSPTR